MWRIEYLEDAVRDLKRLDSRRQLEVLKAIIKVSANRLPNNEEPLGNKKYTRLSGYLKIKLKASKLRVVYRLLREEKIMQIIVIAERDDDNVYKLAQKRKRGMKRD